ncbi:hypothetical protein MASR1M60_16200 [Rhodocyclaceae bacterium]
MNKKKIENTLLKLTIHNLHLGYFRVAAVPSAPTFRGRACSYKDGVCPVSSVLEIALNTEQAEAA